MEKFLKQLPVGKCVLTFAGSLVFEDERGERTFSSCSERWVPWEHDNNCRVVEILNVVSMEGNPGPGVSIEVFETSLRDRAVIKKAKPGFVNPGKELKIWKYKTPLTVFINGTALKQSWTVSHWKQFSGKITFDLAKNGVKYEHREPATDTKISTDSKAQNLLPTSPFDILEEMSQEQKDAIADQQCDHGAAKRI
jgi:hypothetical protein